MDGYQFIAALVGSLAWPAVVGVLLYVLRKHLTGLAERLKELSLPGGMKATFEKELSVGREIVEQLPAQIPAPQLPPPPPEEENKLYRLAIESPKGAIIVSYLELEKELRDIGSRLGMGPSVTNQRSVIEELVEKNLLTRDASRLFNSLRRARNSAAHAVGQEQVTSQDALEYIRQTNQLLALLHFAKSQI